MEISAFIVLVLMFVPASPRYKAKRQLKIHCGKDSRTEKVNVTYIGEARMMYALKNGVKQEKCQAEHVGQAGLVLLDINHRKECGFMHLHKTHTWTIQVRLQHVNKILTAQDKEFYLTCVYDAHKNVSRYKDRSD
ncbi:uncharacterized protein LOC124140886 [Haliotis rufescens]|uniref:uncharacterized protein LOC124140886 n=1 Tax=Haliotis rufescens TaxID=6454 RepID=UPI001EAF9F84|nr:uncharacterized protein LOC124140886 [Haliotis rufescens]